MDIVTEKNTRGSAPTGNQLRPSSFRPSKRVFDCCLFNGEMDVLAIRLHELDAVVDHFVIVEGTLTFSGNPRAVTFDPCDPRVSQFAGKVRHVIVADVPETTDPWVREKWQRNAVLRGAQDAGPEDLLIFSDVDEIPRATVVEEMAADYENELFGVQLAFSYFYVNYRNVAGPESALTWTVAAVRRAMDNILPDDLRHFVRDGNMPARIFENGGWHFSYLMDEAGIRRKIADFSHQEFNNAQFLDKIDIHRIVREERDFFDRPGYEWKLLPATDLPQWLLQNRRQLRQFFHPTGMVDKRDEQLRSIIRSSIAIDSQVFADVFDHYWYLQKHPDVAAAGIDGYQHYVDAGLAEGRAASADMAAFIRVGFASYLSKLKNRLNQATELNDEHVKRLAELSAGTTERSQQQKRDYEELIGLYKAYGVQIQQQLEQSEKREVLLATELSAGREAREAQVMTLQQALDQTRAELDALRAERTALNELVANRDTHIVGLQDAALSREKALAQLQVQYAAQEAKLGEITDRFAVFLAEQDRPIVAAKSLEELLQYQAGQFVDCAYVTLLTRSADPQGRQFYLSRVLSGLPKLQVVKELFESEEARKAGVHLPGLQEALKRYRLAGSPLRRLLFPSLARIDRDSPDQNRLRAIEQKLVVSDRTASGIGRPFVARDGAIARAMTSEPPRPEPPSPEPPSSEPREARTAAPASMSSRAGTSHLPPADGKWEWVDYDVVKERIGNVKRNRADSYMPKPIELIDIGDRPFSSVLQDISLPAPGKTPDVSIILPVFNNLKVTLECLLSISKYADPAIKFEVLVRDDASTDETVKVITAIKNVRLVRNPENVGFLRNCNRAIDSVRGRYVVFLNNDVQVSEGWLSALLDTFSKFPKVGAVGPRYVYPNGRLQEAGAAFRPDGTAQMIGLGEDPEQLRFAYARRVDYTSGACLMLPTSLLKELDGFSEDFLPCYCEDSDLCLRVQERGYFVYCNTDVTVVHHLSKTTASLNDDFKYRCVAKNLNTLMQKWGHRLEKTSIPRVLAFYLPQFHPFPENDVWWGQGFTEWTNVTKAQPNFEGHYQPRFPADLGYYDLRLPEIMTQQADLARSHGIDGFCFYYYWFGGKRLLEAPIEAMLASKTPDFPFCLCWANENWSRRWDGKSSDILMAQQHSPADDIAVIGDLARYFRDPRYIRVDGRPLMLVYRVQLFPNFAQTAERWRTYCRDTGIGEIYLAMVESFELVHSGTNPSAYGCDAAVEFPPQELAESKSPSGAIINPDFIGSVGDFRDLAVRFATRDLPGYTRFLGVAPGWDNTARMQDKSYCFEHSTPGAFQAWLEEAIELTRTQHYGDERLIFVNAWNEWAEGAYLEPDRRFGHAFLEAVRNAKEAALLLRRNAYGLGG